MKIKRTAFSYHDVDYVEFTLLVNGYGVASCMTNKTPRGVFLKNLVVYDEDDYRKGYASKLITAVIASTDNVIELEVLNDNPAAVNLYNKHGFTETLRHKDIISMCR